MPVKNGKGQLRAGAAGRTRSLPTAPALSPRPLACQAAFRVLGAALPASFGKAMWSGSSPRLAVHPGFSHNSRPLGRAAPHRSAHAPAACVPAPQSLDFFFFFPSPPLLLWWQIWFFFLVSFLSFSLSFSFPRSTGRARGRGRLGELWNNVLVQRLQKAGTVRRGLPMSWSGSRVPGWLSPGRAPLGPWTPGPVFCASLPSSSGSVTAPGCWLSPGSPLALKQRPPTSRRTATNQRLAVPL